MNDEQLNRQLRAMVENAAAPLSQTEVVLRASSPIRKSRRDWHLTEHRLIVVAVAAAIVVVFFVPLPSLSLFNRLSHTGLSSEKSYAVTIPAGWVPVTLGDARISVPASWSVLYNTPDCPWGKEPGEVLVNPTPTACPAPPPGDVPKNVIELYSFHGKQHYGHLQVINGITVYWSGGNVYEVPLLGVSIGITGPLGQRVLNTLTRLPKRPTVTTPAGWVPVDYGDAQISIPGSYSVFYPGDKSCGPFTTPGALGLGPAWGSSCPGVPIPTSVKSSTTLSLVPLSKLLAVLAGEKPTVINGLLAYRVPRHSRNRIYDFDVPTLGVQVIASGVNPLRVIDTLTRSPRVVALASGPAPVVPSSWRTVRFAGVRFSVPANWPITRTSGAAYDLGTPCATPGVAFPNNAASLLTYGVTLDTDTHFLPPPSCGTVTPFNQPPTDGVQVDSGSRVNFGVTLSFSTHCLSLGGLTACPATSPAYSILVLRVTVPGRSKPVYVSIGLAGSGMIARTILYSLRTETSTTQMMAMCQPSDLVTRFAGFSGSTVQVGLGTTNVTLDVKNNSRVPCLVGGQPSMAAVSSKGKLIATARAIQAGSNGSADVTVTLPPAGQASIWLGDNNLGCAHPATTLRVLLPGSTTPRALAIEGHIGICPSATVWASTLHSSKLPISARYSSKAYPPGKCSPNFFSPAESARLAAHFGGYGCSRAGNGTGWVIVASGMSQTAPTLSGTPGGSMIAVEYCASTDSRCLNSASVHSFADFTVFYPPNPEGFPLEIQTVPGPSLLDLTDPKCGIWIFDTSTLSWYPGTNNTLRDILAGSLPFPSAAPPPVSGAVAISSGPPPEISALCR